MATPAPAAHRRSVLCVGGANLDRTWRIAGPVHVGASNPARAGAHVGGIARNVAENLVRLGLAARLVSAVGEDGAGARVRDETAAAGVDVSGVRRIAGAATGGYVAVLDRGGDLVIGLADTAAAETLTAEDMARERGHIAAADLVFADTNLAPATLAALRAAAAGLGRPLAVDLVSPGKAGRLGGGLAGVALALANRASAAALVGSGDPEALALAILALGAGQVIVTCGAAGIVHAGAGRARAYPAPASHVVDVTGAGDALTAGAIAGLLAGLAPEAMCRCAQEAARLTLAVPGPVSTALTPDCLGLAVAGAP
jgi:pseudouridine kinase